MPKIITEEYKDNQGKEAGLSVLSRMSLVLAIAGMLGCIIIGLALGRLVCLAIGIVILIAGLILYVIFGALSEIIRLLKAVAGLPYSGVISGGSSGIIHVCSECGSLNYADIQKCRKCGVEFDKNESASEL